MDGFYRRIGNIPFPISLKAMDMGITQNPYQRKI
jgi:hypothetical protein